MRIADIRATPLAVPCQVSLGGAEAHTLLSCCLVEVETEDGLIGHGFTAITEEEVVAAIMREVLAPALQGADALRHEQLWERMYWLLAPRGQTGYAAHAIAAVDLALWDLKGRHYGAPVWRLLGAARERVPAYCTFGFGFFDRDALAAAARAAVARGFGRLKMTVGSHALARRDEPRPVDRVIREDAARVRAVRDAVGEDVEIFVDANCSLDGVHAARLARDLEDAGVALFEEPVTQNDVRLLAGLRRRTSIPLACGQNEGLGYRFRDLLVAQAVDVLQPNVAITGGITQCLRIAGMASAFNVPIDNGGAWPFHNVHLHAGVANGGMVEYHLVAAALCEAVCGPLPAPAAGWLAAPEVPGLGFVPDPGRVRELAKAPLSRGRGKA